MLQRQLMCLVVGLKPLYFTVMISLLLSLLCVVIVHTVRGDGASNSAVLYACPAGLCAMDVMLV